MFGGRAVELIRELDRTDEDQLLPFNGDTLAQVEREMKEHAKEINKIFRRIANEGQEDSPNAIQYSAALLVHDNSIKRNKRCVLAYLYHRFQKITGLRWQVGSAILDEEIQSKLSQSEKEAFKAYCDNLADYMIGIEMNLVVDTDPPKDPFIEVRVLKATGEIVVEDKTLHLDPNSVHLLKRADAEPLILQGLLEHKVY